MIITEKVNPVIDIKVRHLCKKPYINHSQGCPNYGRKDGCPPSCPVWTDIFNIGLATHVIYTCFNLKEHREKMLKLHPSWTKRQANCCLYWQPKARKPLQNYIKKSLLPGYEITMCPEAMGTNVTETMRQIGIELEWPPENLVYQVAMGGWLL
jgi:predicted metal-binding protein